MKNKIRVLNYKNVAKGIKLCLDNAKGLIEDAEILRDNQRYRGSVIFALFAWEECAKIEQIFNLLELIRRRN